MKFPKQKILLLSFLAIYPFAQAQPTNNQTHAKIEQVKVLLDQLQKDISQFSQIRVYTGTAQVTANNPSEMLNAYSQQLIAALNSYADLSVNFVPTLQWQAATSTNLPKEKRINAGLANETVNICRAPFMGADTQSKAFYPGQLTSAGCRISYAGYAFTVTKFDVLTGSDSGLQWIAMADIKNTMNAKKQAATNQLPPTSQIARNPLTTGYSGGFIGFPPQPSFDFNIKINGASPVAGGYEGGNPVLICRVKQNNATIIGKLVFFVPADGRTQDACDIGVDDKEVVIENNYELLFWKANT